MSMVDNLINGVTQALTAKYKPYIEQINKIIGDAAKDAAAVKNEVLAAKSGFVNVATTFKTQLDRIEAQNVTIIEQNAAIMRALNLEVQNGDHGQRQLENGASGRQDAA